MLTILMTILMTWLFFKVTGLLLRAGFGIAKGLFGFIGFLIMAALVVSFAGVVFLPLLLVVGLIALLCGGIASV